MGFCLFDFLVITEKEVEKLKDTDITKVFPFLSTYFCEQGLCLL